MALLLVMALTIRVEGTYVPYVLRLPIGQIVQQIFGKTHQPKQEHKRQQQGSYQTTESSSRFRPIYSLVVPCRFCFTRGNDRMRLRMNDY